MAERLGPLIAIANPNTTLPLLGAAQEYYSNDTWQTAIARWVEMAEMIVMVAGRTKGIRWELDHIFSKEEHPKLVIFFPPDFRRYPAAGAQWLKRHFSHTRYAADLLANDLTGLIAIAFSENGICLIKTRRNLGHEVDYFVAFQAIIFATVVQVVPAITEA
jgi:hypothetical protein